MALLSIYFVVTGLTIWLVGSSRGTEIFPQVDSGQFQLRLRAAPGTRIDDYTEELAKRALDVIQAQVGAENVDTTVGFGGVSPSTYSTSCIYVWTAGPEEVVLRVALKHGSGVRIDELKERLRARLPEQLGLWLREHLAEREDIATDEIEARVQGLRLSFEPSDIVDEVMSFGSRTPIEVAVSGPNFDDSRAFALKVRDQLARVPSLRDLQFVQSLDYPTVEVNVDRQRAGLSGVTTDDLARSLVAATSSSRFVVPNHWRDPKKGIGYQVQVEVPQAQMDSANAIGLVPIKHKEHGLVLVRDVVEVTRSTMPGEYDRYNMRRLVSLTANIQGEDLGRVANRIDQAIRAAGDPPRGVTVDIRGQVVPMRQLFAGLTAGIGLAVAVIFLLLTAYFQSPRLALLVTTTVPAVLTGVVLALFLTGTTINIQSFMGAIMAIGVAVANAILLVTFAERSRMAGMDVVTAAVEGARGRLRPILMTSLAMIAGMMPMALALGEGGEQTAPLGRAVIGGLAAATLATLVILPAAFVAVQGRASLASVSLDPFDPESKHHVPPVEGYAGPHGSFVKPHQHQDASHDIKGDEL